MPRNLPKRMPSLSNHLLTTSKYNWTVFFLWESIKSNFFFDILSKQAGVRRNKAEHPPKAIFIGSSCHNFRIESNTIVLRRKSKFLYHLRSKFSTCTLHLLNWNQLNWTFFFDVPSRQVEERNGVELPLIYINQTNHQPTNLSFPN